MLQKMLSLQVWKWSRIVADAPNGRGGYVFSNFKMYAYAIFMCRAITTLSLQRPLQL
jgi:hypothetical protein